MFSNIYTAIRKICINSLFFKGNNTFLRAIFDIAKYLSFVQEF